jgi:retron-type reverse transcriptase
MDTQELLQRGIDRYKQRDYENALEDFNQVISLNPTLAKAYHYRGWIYKTLKKKEEAIQNLQHAASILKDREYSVLCKKIIALLDKLFPSKEEEKDSEDDDYLIYSNLFWRDDAGNFYDEEPDYEGLGDNYTIEDYYAYIEEDLQPLQNFTFQRLQRIELLQIKREKNAKFEPERLEKNGLPMCNSHQEIARLMRISVKVLRFFAFSRKKTAYNCFQIPKKTGGNRKISAPRPLLKKSQQWILHNILEKIEVHNAAHGFCLNHSIVTNAQPHVGADIVINFDLKDFFPSISYPRVKGLFKSFGYSETASIIFGLLCTEQTLKQIELDGEIHWLLSWTERHLPQGAPTSPAITNLLCRTLDKRLTQMAKRYGFVYTRYADNLTFSACGDSLGNIANLMKGTRSIVKSEGFNINEEKTRLLRKSRQQEVTGIVVNDKVNVSREKLKRFRATLYQIEKDGLIGKHWGDSKKRDLIPSLEGFANFVFMVNPEKGSLFREQVKRIKEKYAKGKYSTSNALPKILNQSDLIALIYAELKRLGGTGESRRFYLKYTYGKQSLQQLTEENLLVRFV